VSDAATEAASAAASGARIARSPRSLCATVAARTAPS
jgi:hypothetical protein